MIDFTTIIVGREYDRPTLAKLWGYETYNAISRGVISPKGENILVFFITKEKQTALTQYEDHIDADILFWEGEQGHGNDHRIAAQQDTIHIFFREHHHSSFVYEGRAVLRSYCLNTERPSKFSFELIDKKIEEVDMVAEIRSEYSIAETEREALVKSRIGQGLYRSKAIELWKSCSVTGFTKENVLVASHIKPWKVSTNSERLSPFNSLLLIPTLDKLFDKGYMGFEPNGKIMLSGKVEEDDWRRIGVNRTLRLRDVPFESKAYLEYHSEYIYDLMEA
jgi:putative restriction endonuclease